MWNSVVLIVGDQSETAHLIVMRIVFLFDYLFNFFYLINHNIRKRFYVRFKFAVWLESFKLFIMCTKSLYNHYQYLRFCSNLTWILKYVPFVCVSIKYYQVTQTEPAGYCNNKIKSCYFRCWMYWKMFEKKYLTQNLLLTYFFLFDENKKI